MRVKFFIALRPHKKLRRPQSHSRWLDDIIFSNFIVNYMGHPLLDLTNKTAVVIGGTSGIGLAIAKALAKAGANVVPTGRRTDLVKAAAAEIENLGRRSLAEACDVTENASIENLLKSVIAKLGSVHIL